MPRMDADWHKDADGHARPDQFSGKQFFHPKTGHLYEVTGYGIDAERELWLLHYRQVGTVPSYLFTHTISDFTRRGRFLEVKE